MSRSLIPDGLERKLLWFPWNPGLCLEVCNVPCMETTDCFLFLCFGRGSLLFLIKIPCQYFPLNYIFHRKGIWASQKKENCWQLSNVRGMLLPVKISKHTCMRCLEISTENVHHLLPVPAQDWWADSEATINWNLLFTSADSVVHLMGFWQIKCTLYIYHLGIRIVPLPLMSLVNHLFYALYTCHILLLI